MSGPGFSQDLRQRQTQSMVLAPQLRQSLKILQVAALDLRSVIQEELQNNPTLEEMPMEGVSLDKEQTDKSNESGENGSSETPEQHEEMDFSNSKEYEILSKLNEDWRDHMAQAGGSQPYTSEDAEKRQHFFDSLVTETSLQEHLMQQADLADIEPKVLEAMRHLVGSLDDRGFLTQSAADVALQTNLPLDVVQQAIKLLKTFDPPGIGCQNIAESQIGRAHV